MTAAEAEQLVRDALLSSDKGINGELALDFLVSELARKDEALRLSYPRTPVDCLLSTLSEIDSPFGPMGVVDIREHVRNSCREARAALGKQP